MDKKRVIIVGGGAAGLVAAIAAARGGASVTVLEAASRVGQKILKTGNGRCNITNMHACADDYNVPDAVKPVLGTWTPQHVIDFFESVGLLTVEEEQGRVYPLSNSAGNVLNVLRFACRNLGVESQCEKEVVELKVGRDCHSVVCSDGSSYEATRLVLATGGASKLLTQAGHSLTSFKPALCGIETETAPLKGLDGQRAHVSVRAYHKDDLRNPFFEESGEVQFRKYGLSGIVIFNLSRHVSEGDRICIDLLPSIPTVDFAAWLEQRYVVLNDKARESGTKNPTYEELMCGCLQPLVNNAILRAAQLKPSQEVDPTQLLRIAQCAHSFELVATGRFKGNAQITQGGAPMDEFDQSTLESRIAPGVFAAGEILDVDGPCGGYNLQWAWTSGLVAGSSAALEARG